MRGGPEPALRPPSRGELRAGDRIGRYIVLEPLGEGGMGVVYTAYDPELDRKVAIKLLKSSGGSGSQSDGQARLLREAQAMAQLSHPNVVAVYDVGPFRDSVFMAMEWVRGENLRTWMTPVRQDWRATLSMFVAAGHGLEAAHRAGLVHRDFKPANVLVGDDGRARVTDFGLARINPSDAASTRVPVDAPLGGSLRTPLTVVGAVMGSPGYMAPEQYSGAPTSPATDQFSFCVSLYEGLYGRLPFEGTTFLELAESTTAGRIASPPRGSPVPGRVFRILSQGMAIDPARRHASMGALLASLAHDPARARRRALAVGGGVIVLAALTVGGRWLLESQARFCRGAEQKLAGVWDDATRAESQRAFESTGRAYAPSVWEAARRELDAYAQRWVAARTEACQATRLRGEQSEQMMQLRFSCLERRLDELGALSSLFRHADPQTVDHAPSAASSLPSLSACADLKALADPRQAVPVALRQEVEEVRRKLVQGRALFMAGKFAPAEAALSVATQRAQASRFAPLQAEADESMGRLLVSMRRLPEARASYERAVGEAEAASDDATAALALTKLVSLVGYRMEKPAEGRPLAGFARGVIERLGGDAQLTGELAQGLGDLEWQAGDSTESLARFREARVSYRKANNLETIEVAYVESQIGYILMEQGVYDEAEIALRHALAIREKIFGADHPINVESWNNLGELAQHRRRWTEAAEDFKHAIGMLERLLPERPLDQVIIKECLADVLAETGHPGEALELARQSLLLLDRHPESVVMERLAGLNAEAHALRVLHRYREAVETARKSLQLAESALGNEHPQTGEAERRLGGILSESGEATEAVALLDRYLARKERIHDVRDPAYGEALAESALALQALHRRTEARARLERAIGAYRGMQDVGAQEAEARTRLAQLPAP